MEKHITVYTHNPLNASEIFVGLLQCLYRTYLIGHLTNL